VSLGVFAADTSGWAIRYEAGPTGRDRVIVCYKYPNGADPYVDIDRSRVTAEWRNPILARPESLLLGAMYSSYENPSHGDPWVISHLSAVARWIFVGTSLAKGSRLPDLVGYEYDKVVAGYPVPPHLTVLSYSPVTDYQGRHDVANSTIYTAKSGARVFNAGTIQWSWGLDGYVVPWRSDSSSRSKYWPNPAVQRITAKVLQLLAKGSTAHQ
jgi:hypothetical protein